MGKKRIKKIKIKIKSKENINRTKKRVKKTNYRLNI